MYVRIPNRGINKRINNIFKPNCSDNITIIHHHPYSLSHTPPFPCRKGGGGPNECNHNSVRDAAELSCRAAGWGFSDDEEQNKLTEKSIWEWIKGRQGNSPARFAASVVSSRLIAGWSCQGVFAMLNPGRRALLCGAVHWLIARNWFKGLRDIIMMLHVFR